MQVVKTIGNQDLLNREKTLFLCSKRTPIGFYKYVFQWTDSLTERDCIACFNTTDMESEVLKALLVGRVPTILFVMNRFVDVNNIQIQKAIQERRMAIFVLRRDKPQDKGLTPRLRNEYILSICQHVVCGYVNKNGSVFGLLAGRNNVKRLIDEKEPMIAAESETHHERWTVAQDKVLLRMFYSDMGIHAIHKQLHRTYSAVYTRLRSITQSEEVLKGREFEDYVLSLFNIQEGGNLVLLEWQSDKSSGKIQPENNSNPDFIFRYDKKEFAIECKWRAKLKDLEKDLFTAKRIGNYKNFSEKRNMSVTIILGVGGEPSSPELIYRIPLEKISFIISSTISIKEFLLPVHLLDASTFVRQKNYGEKAYTIEEKRKKHLNAYKPWRHDDDEQLKILYSKKMSIKELSSIFMRNEGAIRSRLKKLGE